MKDEETDVQMEKVPDPRVALAEWANDQDEWVRKVVREVLATNRPASDAVIADAYELFRQEKALDTRDTDPEPEIELGYSNIEEDEPVTIGSISEVTGVNAITPGSVIEPDAGLTILFGENGTGKTGYARVLKALADSRTAVEILGDVAELTEQDQSARIKYQVGDQQEDFLWSGERGVSPFTKMAIFDSPSVDLHVDDDLEYVYTPSVLALFNHVVAGLKGVQTLIATRISDLSTSGTRLLERFPRSSSVYAEIETLGATTDLSQLGAKKHNGTKDEADNEVEQLSRVVAALQANTSATMLELKEQELRVIKQAMSVARKVSSIDAESFNKDVAMKKELEADREAFRNELFQSAKLPTEPEANWEQFGCGGPPLPRTPRCS